MEYKLIAITFEPQIPVVGQVLILEALDYWYSVHALQELGWRANLARDKNWYGRLADAPGKLLSEEHLLRLESARTGSVTEVVKGVAKPAAGALETLLTYKVRVRKIEAQVQLMQLKGQEYEVTILQKKLELVRDTLLPLITKLKRSGAPDEHINSMLAKAHMYLEDVLARLMDESKLKIAEE